MPTCNTGTKSGEQIIPIPHLISHVNVSVSWLCPYLFLIIVTQNVHILKNIEWSYMVFHKFFIHLETFRIFFEHEVSNWPEMYFLIFRENRFHLFLILCIRKQPRSSATLRLSGLLLGLSNLRQLLYQDLRFQRQAISMPSLKAESPWTPNHVPEGSYVYHR